MKLNSKPCVASIGHHQTSRRQRRTKNRRRMIQKLQVAETKRSNRRNPCFLLVDQSRGTRTKESDQLRCPQNNGKTPLFVQDNISNRTTSISTLPRNGQVDLQLQKHYWPKLLREETTRLERPLQNSYRKYTTRRLKLSRGQIIHHGTRCCC